MIFESNLANDEIKPISHFQVGIYQQTVTIFFRNYFLKVNRFFLIFRQVWIIFQKYIEIISFSLRLTVAKGNNIVIGL